MSRFKKIVPGVMLGFVMVLTVVQAKADLESMVATGDVECTNPNIPTKWWCSAGMICDPYFDTATQTWQAGCKAPNREIPEFPELPEPIDPQQPQQ